MAHSNQKLTDFGKFLSVANPLLCALPKEKAILKRTQSSDKFIIIIIIIIDLIRQQLFNYSCVIFFLPVQDLSKLGTYGGNDSIVAFARNHGVNIVIHQLNEPRWVINGGDYCKNGGQIRELHISYHNGEHYSSIRHISDNTSEPAWAKINQAIFTSVSMVSTLTA